MRRNHGTPSVSIKTKRGKRTELATPNPRDRGRRQADRCDSMFQELYICIPHQTRTQQKLFYTHVHIYIYIQMCLSCFFWGGGLGMERGWVPKNYGVRISVLKGEVGDALMHKCT